MIADETNAKAGSLYRAVWRWHFYAGFLVLPFLVLLATTGGLYLYSTPLDHLIYRSWENVPIRPLPPLSYGALIEKAGQAMDGRVLQFVRSDASAQSVHMVIRNASGESRTAFIDPYDGRLLGSTTYGGVMQVIRKIHSLQQFGFWASCLIEIAAGWTIVLVGTGIYLWWPRRQKGGVVTIRGGPTARVFWRDLHALTGVFVGSVIVFLAVTGMPWSEFWGTHVQNWTSARGWGEPQPPAEVVPDWAIALRGPPPGQHHHEAKANPDLPWALEKVPPPASEPAGGRKAIGIDAVLAVFERVHLPQPFSVTLPGGPRGAYMGAYRPNRVEDTRIVYVDQYTGQVLGDVGFAQFGPAAKAIEWGIQVHQGLEYGAVNRGVMLAGCISILILSLSAVIMWWKRRPRGTLGIPPMPEDTRVIRGLIGIMIPICIIYPLVGISFVSALGFDYSFRLLKQPRAC